MRGKIYGKATGERYGIKQQLTVFPGDKIMRLGLVHSGLANGSMIVNTALTPADITAWEVNGYKPVVLTTEGIQIRAT